MKSNKCTNWVTVPDQAFTHKDPLKIDKIKTMVNSEPNQGLTMEDWNAQPSLVGPPEA